ncbi:MAG: TonB-dependent receptor [Alphaproteobacteria bacterium]|nr:TonB-dependent receptor [Alphaproteobacteria bacterium]
MAYGSHLTLKSTAASLGVIGAMLAMDAAPAFAQLAVEEIVVTTRKRSESLQEVPLAITAFTADTLERKGLSSIEDVARLTAGVQVDQGTFPQDVRITIRGLAPSRGRTNVALLLDGVDVSSESIQSAGGSLLVNNRLFDLERVEIVKGPQSALYGRSAFAGAINYVTKKPTNEWEGKFSLNGGQRNQVEATVGLYGPVVEDKFLIGVNASVWNFDGFHDNSVTGADLADSDGYGLALSSIWNANEDVSLTTRIEYTDDHLGQSAFAFGGQNTQLPVPASAFGPIFDPGVVSPAVPFVGVFAGVVPDASDLPEATISEDPATGKEFRGSEREIFRVAATLDWDLGFGSFTSVTHYASADVSQDSENNRQGSFFETTSGTMFSVESETKLFSEEIRLQSNDDERLRWMIGGLYWEEKVDQDSHNLACTNNQLFPGIPFLPCGIFFAQLDGTPPNMWVRDTEHLSAFAMFEYDFTDQLTFHVEGRYTDEDQFVSGPTGPRIVDAFGVAGPPNPLPMASPNIDATSSDSFFTPRFSLEYTASDDMLFYGSVAKGAKPAGISTVGAGAAGFTPETFRFDRETMWVYEVGTKTSWDDGKVIANAAVYYEDFSGKQTATQFLADNGLTGTRTVNASSAEVKGLELDLAWAPVNGLNLTASYSYIDATYNDFIVNGTGVATIAAVGNCTIVLLGTNKSCALDRTGNELEDVAKHSFVGGISYSQPLTDEVNWLIETDVQYQDDRFDTSDNILIMPSYWMVDLRAGLVSDNWSIVAFANNLFNDDTVKQAFNTTDFTTINLAFFPPPTTFILENALQAQLPDKRQIGVRTTFNF